MGLLGSTPRSDETHCLLLTMRTEGLDGVKRANALRTEVPYLPARRQGEVNCMEGHARAGNKNAAQLAGAEVKGQLITDQAEQKRVLLSEGRGRFAVFWGLDSSLGSLSLSNTLFTHCATLSGSLRLPHSTSGATQDTNTYKYTLHVAM